MTGTQVISPGMSTTYTLTATNQAGSATATTQIILSATAPTTPTIPTTPTTPALTAPPLITFTASPTSIQPGGSATLQWNVTGAGAILVKLSQQTVPPAGTMTVSPTSTTAYTLTATNTAGTVTKSASVTVATATSPPGTTTLSPGYIPVSPGTIDPSLVLPTTTTVTLHYESYESGTVWSNGSVSSGDMMLGDSVFDLIGRAYVSFDISSLAGSDVTSAKLTFNQSNLRGNPFTYGPLGLSEVWYGPRALIPTDYTLPTRNNLGGFTTGSGSINVTQFVKQAVYNVNQKDRFQVRFRFPFDTDNDGHSDWIVLDPVTLEVTYLK